MSVARYTRFVAMSKHSLWVLVVLMVGVVVWIASDNSSENKARIVFSHIAKSTNLQNIMSKPYYQGVDAHNRPYTIIAEKAIQLDKDNIALEKIHADMVMGNGVWVALNSDGGALNMQTKQLMLKGGVDVFYNEGYEFRTDHAMVDITKGTAYADSAVEGQGPLGTLKADSFSATDHGQVIHFIGSVRMKIYR